VRRVLGRAKPRRPRWAWIAGVFACALCGFQVDAPRGCGAPPSRPLEAGNLQPWGNSGVWLCEEERQLRRDLASLPALRQSIEELQKSLATTLASNRARWSASHSAANASQAAAIPRGKSPPAGEATGEGRAAAAVDPAKIGDVPVVRQAVIRLTNARIQLAMTLARIRRGSSAMAATYQRLADDSAIQTALAEVGAAAGSDQRLGPASDYDGDLRRLRDDFALAETPWVPAYLLGQHLRFTGICNERAPATFTWSPDLRHALVTTGSFQAAGLQLPDDSRPSQFRYQGSTIDVQRIRLPYLQFGNCLLRDVPALLLPPEYEHLGNRIGGPTFEGYQVRPDPARLRVTLKPPS